MIVLRALGSAEIETGVMTVTPSQGIVFAAALYLVLERGKRVSRARLSSLLWPRVAEKPRAHRMRQTILQLKKVGIIVRADRNTLQLPQHDARSDVDDLSSADATPALKHDSLEFLPGYNPQLSEAFRDWVDTKRGETNALATHRLIAALDVARRKGDWAVSAALAGHCLRLDPFNESAVLAHAEATAMRGAKREAVALLDRYINEVGSSNQDLRLPASLLRSRIRAQDPEPPAFATRECTFVGRNREMEILILQLTAAHHSQGGACLITGEAGIGKSRIASELMKFAELDGIQTESAICRRADIERPLSVFVDLVPHLRELPGALGCTPETLSVLKHLTEFDSSASEDAVWVDDSGMAYAKLRHALFDLFDAIADEQCLLIVLEDVQWLDRSSARLLSAMISWAKTRRVFFLLNERAASSEFSTQVVPTDLPTLALSPLEPAFAMKLVNAIVDEESRKVDPDVIKWLLSVGEGNPFFLQELAKQWLETGKQHEFPPSLSAVIDDRLSRLSKQALQVLQTCAVLGMNATIERVERVLDLKSHELFAAVQELGAAGMLQEETQTSTDVLDELNVRHDLLSTAALARLAKKPLGFLHRRAGTVLELETVGKPVSTSLLWACAFHWREAGDRERALNAVRTCAEHLLEVGFPVDAGKAFEGALDYCGTDEQRLLVLPRLAIALQTQGRWEDSKDILHRCRQIRSKITPTANPHDDEELALFDASWRVSLGNTSVLTDILACVDCANATEFHRVASGMLGLKLASNLTEIGIVGALYRKIEPLLDHPTIRPITRFEVDMIFHSACGDIEKASEATKQFLAAVRAENDLLTFSRALVNAGVAHRLGGRKDEAEALFLEALDHAASHGLLVRAQFAGYSLVRLYLAAGDVQQAQRVMERTELMAPLNDDAHDTADRLYLTARLALEAGDIAAASSRYEILRTQTTPNQSINRVSAALALGIRIKLLEGVSANSLRPLVSELESAHLINRGAGWQDFETHALYLGLRTCGELERGERLLKEYATVYRREKGPLPPNLSELLDTTAVGSEGQASDPRAKYSAREQSLIVR